MKNRVLLLAALALAGLRCAPCGAISNRVDFNNDGTVNIVDAVMMADDWLGGLTEDGLVAYWQLNETSGDSAAERVGGHTGTLVGSPEWRPGEGMHEGSLLLGYGQYVQATGYKGISGTAPRTCSVWIRTSVDNRVIVSWGSTAPLGAKWLFHLNGGLLRVAVGGGYAVGSTPVADNEWHRVTVVSDGTTTDNIKFYVDGVADPLSDVGSHTINTGSDLDVHIGQFNGGSYFTGFVDDVRIYERVVTPEELAKPSVDLNGDFRINLDDFKILSDNWQWQMPSVLLAENGTAALPIIIRSTTVNYNWGLSPTTGEPQVAFELAGLLEEMTGAQFEVVYDVAGTATEGIFVGVLADFPEFAAVDPTIATALEIRGKFYDGVESYAIRTEPNQLIILGANPLGASHGVSAFLESLGYRQFFPGERWEIIPSLPTLNVSLNVDNRPDFLALMAGPGRGFVGTQGEDEYDEWRRRNRRGRSLPVFGGHVYQTIIADNQAVFDAHPEYYPLVNGVRQTTGQLGLCVSNPAVVQICQDWAIQYFVDNPQAVMVSMETSDGAPDCKCGVGDITDGNCDAIGTDDPFVDSTGSDLTFWLANQVAPAVEAAYPGQNKLVGLLSYPDHSDPPSFLLEDNIYVQITHIWQGGQYSYEELVELWPQIAGGVGFYEYWAVYYWNFDMLPNLQMNSAAYLEKMFRWWYDISPNGRTVQAEIGHGWGPNGRGYYLASQLRWDAYTDVDAFLDDFYTKAFGPAATAMKSFYDHIDGGLYPIVDDHIMSLMFRDIETATAAAAGYPKVLARLDDLKYYLRYFRLWHERELWRKNNPDCQYDQQPSEDLALEILTLGYRGRYSYMTDWAALGSFWIWQITQGAETTYGCLVGDPVTWDYAYPDAPWRDPCELTSAEIETWFQEGLAYFPLLGVVERDFSDDLVAVKFENYSAPASTVESIWKNTWQSHGMYHGVYSVAGENLNIDLKSEADSMHAPLYWRIEDPCGVFIADGHLSQDPGVWQNISVPVPAAGAYILYNQTADIEVGRTWAIRTQVDVPLSVRTHDAQMYSDDPHPWYFYVPAGTTNIYFYPGYIDESYQVRDSSGSVRATVTGDKTVKTVAVPPGQDGKPWSVNIAYRRQGLWFYNCPNWISASLNALMVPRDVAISDGLEMR